MIELIKIDNRMPPTWDGVAAPIAHLNDFADSKTGLRYTLRQDYYNYFTQQRVEGDLFKRDLIPNENLERLIDFLSKRSGTTFCLPRTVILPQTFVSLGRVYLHSSFFARAHVVFAALHPVELNGAAHTDIRLEVIEVAGNSDVTVGNPIKIAYGDASRPLTEWGAATPTDPIGERGPTLDVDTEYDVRVTNIHQSLSIRVAAEFTYQPSKV